MSRRGALVSIEGIDAVGKQTQSRLLESWLSRSGISTASFSFPAYETPVGKEIRALLTAKRDSLPELRHILFAANRWEKVPEIARELESGKFLIVNRYSESNLVYGIANGLKASWLTSLEKGVPKSDLVLVLDAPAAHLGSRRPGEKKDAYEKNLDLQSRARQLYRELAVPSGWTVIDGTKDIESVHSAVRKAVRKKILGGTKTWS